MDTKAWLDAANHWQSALGGVFTRLQGKPVTVGLRSGAQFQVRKVAPLANVSGELAERRKPTFAVLELVSKEGQAATVVCPYHELSYVLVPGQHDDLLTTAASP